MTKVQLECIFYPFWKIGQTFLQIYYSFSSFWIASLCFRFHWSFILLSFPTRPYPVSCPVSSFLLIKRSFISPDAATALPLAGRSTNQKAGWLLKRAARWSTWGQRSSGRCQQVACCNIHVYLSSTLSLGCHRGLFAWRWHHVRIIARLQRSAKAKCKELLFPNKIHFHK